MVLQLVALKTLVVLQFVTPTLLGDTCVLLQYVTPLDYFFCLGLLRVSGCGPTNHPRNPRVPLPQFVNPLDSGKCSCVTLMHRFAGVDARVVHMSHT